MPEPLEPDWTAVIPAAATLRPDAVRAETFLGKKGTASKPVRFSCSDGQTYWVKGGHAGRQVVNDQIVGRLGSAFGAPVGQVGFVDVSEAIVQAEMELKVLVDGKPFQAGTWHGCVNLEGVSDDCEGLTHADVPENRPRFALLALLYDWATGNNCQYLYTKAVPRLVYSVDHGHFFPGGPDWKEVTLPADGGGAQAPDCDLARHCVLTDAELNVARAALRSIDAADAISRAVAAPLDAWSITEAERVALGHHLWKRYHKLAGEPTAQPT